MQYQPNAAELLAAIGELLHDELLPALSGALKHQCRIAANLAEILERQERLGPEASARERDRLSGLLGHDGDVVELAAELADRIKSDDDPAFQRQAWGTLVAVARDDLAIAKPGHDTWEGP